MQFRNLGIVSFEDFLEIQEQYALQRQEGKREDTILFAEHHPAISIGGSSAEKQLEDVRVTPQELVKLGIPVVRTKRGGTIAVHGPGILGCYFIFGVERYHVLRFLDSLEALAVHALRRAGLPAAPLSDGLKTDCAKKQKYRGAWVGLKKVATIGINMSRGVTSFGMNINIAPHPTLLTLVHPCGIREYELTSVAAEGGNPDVFFMMTEISQLAPKYFEA